jgi:3-hydroxyisobutyrate dehydrogenase-like beta-hydroxyacid dehydrogenase
MTQTKVTVVGLGAMGATIAELFMKAGARVTVWNRTADKAARLVERGALPSRDLPAAIAASDVSFVIVSNDRAVSEILTTPGVAGALAGRSLVQLTTISPETAREGAEFARRHGAAYLSGAIQAAPGQMGQPETPLLIAGDERAWARHRDLLGTLAGGLVYLGADPGAAATMDLATLSWVYGGFLGFLQGALIARAQGVDVAEYGEMVERISPSFGAFFAHEGAVLKSGDYAARESPLRISVDATQRLLETAERSGLNTELPALVSSLFQRAARRGLLDEEVAALIKVMEPVTAPAP